METNGYNNISNISKWDTYGHQFDWQCPDIPPNFQYNYITLVNSLKGFTLIVTTCLDWKTWLGRMKKVYSLII